MLLRPSAGLRRCGVVIAAASLALSGFSSAALAAADPTATFAKVSDWGSGFTGQVVVKAGDAALTSWTVKFDLPAGTSIGSTWEAGMTRTGDSYTFVNRPYNGSVAAGASTTFGFNGVGPGAPINCTINDTPCDGSSGAPDTEAPTVPTGLTAGETGSSTVPLSWTASTDNVGVTGYDVFQGASTTPIATSTSASLLVGGLQPETTYTFRVRARDKAGNVSALSTQVSATTKEFGDPGPGGKRKVGYFTQWGIYDRAYYVKNLDTSGSAAKLTHINYSFGNLDSSGRCFQANQLGQGDAWADYQRRFTADLTVNGQGDVYNQPLAGNLNQLKQLKAKHPHLKVNLSLGGWTWSKYFSDAALTAASRQAHVSSCLDMWIKGNLPKIGGEPQGGPGSAAGVFDGIDLDWEWPGSEGNTGNVVRPEDKQNFTLLVQEWRRQLDAYGATTGKHYELTAFLPADPDKVVAGFEVNRIFDSLDFATLQGYDLHGAWDPVTNNQSALRLPANDPGPKPYSVEIATNAWTSRGAPANRLVLGVPFYSRGWTGVTNANNGLHQKATDGAPGRYEKGIEDYKLIKPLLNSGYQLHRDAVSGHAWLFNGSTFWTFDDPAEIARKTAWITANGLGGAMIWSMDGDTANGELMTAVHQGIG
ncbi:glycoside hydrolase family 18 chitinase [Kibdelosporangium phytohabitans]|uniref:chitinase n=1 Tax=Kibdelosporangium phytohabitans TaxID=860235 RepID=A0A0N9I0I4_9PSEU|nr:glycoside hydrolase family 18 chitinase [Kibdelosporangium phytohabitans]ALG11658.1 glycoside hydrolase [Kibdelosporangium phytohabitans]MBE1463045.1 chitinase [Kibdelosporangium phytohabitans]